MKRFKYILNGSWNYYDLHADNQKSALKLIRKIWNLSHYQTKKVEIWETEKTVEQEIADKQDFFKDVLVANPHLCLTDF